MKTIIVTYDKTAYEVTKEDAEKISNIIALGKAKFIKIKENMVSISNIAQLIDSKEYYDQHPRRKPAKEPFFKDFSALQEPKTTYSDERHKTRLEKMRNGFLIGARVKTKEELSDKQRAVYNTIEAGLIKLTK